MQNNDDGNARRTMVVYMTNVVVAACRAGSGSAGHGVWLNGNADSKSAMMAAVGVNCTIADNAGRGLFLDSSEGSGSSVVLYNSIVARNGGDGIRTADLSAGGPAITEEFNDFYGNTGANLVRVGTGGTNAPALNGSDVTGDPRFAGAGGKAEPYNLGSGSPCFNAASAAYAPDVDVLGTPRPVKRVDDIGAYELIPPRGTVILLR